MNKPKMLVLAALAAAAVAIGALAAAPSASAALGRSTTIVVRAASIQDAIRKRPVRWHSGSRPKNTDQIVENIGISLTPP
jgi:ABC-type glycerol-3-phosphate transport system substrate-binding protein